MKAWNPKSEKFDAVPPLPEFVGRWRIPGGKRASGDPTLFWRLVRRVLDGAASILDRVDRTMEAVEAREVIPDTPTQPIPRSAAVPIPDNRIVLPMSSGVDVKPGASVRITGRPQSVAFRPERIIIGGDPEHWSVSDIKIGRRSQLTGEGDLPGAAFAADAEDVNVRLDVVHTAMNFTMVVNYVGPSPEGAPFSCAVLGVAALPASSLADADDLEICDVKIDGSGRIYLPLSSGVNLLPGTSALVKANPQDPFRVERILIGGDPGAWIVNDIKVGNRSQLSQRGDIPGAMFAKTARNSFVSFETVQTAMDFTILVTYVGTKPEGEPLMACAIGTVPT